MSFRGWVGAWTGLTIAAAIVGCGHLRGPTPPRQSALEQAKASLRDGRPDRALPLLIDLQLRSPDDLEIAKLAVEAYLGTGREEELISALSSSSPRGATSHYMLGLTYAANSNGDGTDAAWIQAAREFESAIALNPGEAELHHRFGLALLQLGRHQESVDSFARALEMQPDRTAAYLPLVKALHASGRTGEALAVLSKWVVRHPKESEVTTAKALLDQFVPPLAGLSGSSEQRFLRAVGLLQEEDDPLAAIAVFDELVRENPAVAICHTLLALCYQRLDQGGRAMDELRQASALAPHDGRNHYYLGELYLGRGQVERAAESFRRAVELNPLLDEPHLRLGELALEKSDFKTASSHLGIAALLSTKAAVRVKLARALQLEGDYPGAERELRALLDRDPENPQWMLLLGLLHLEEHRRSDSLERRSSSRAEAIRWLRAVLRLQGDNVTAARALESLGAG